MTSKKKSVKKTGKKKTLKASAETVKAAGRSVAPVRATAIMQSLKLKPDEGALRAYIEEHATECYLCEDFVPLKDIRGNFCYGCRKLICDKHSNGEIPMGGHSPEAHEEDEDDDDNDQFEPEDLGVQDDG